jgi:2-polyprenyl-6-methoxyphenol hydroxylase-like FAD-dependent oxidoreductase
MYKGTLPGGAMLALFLARKGVPVTLLEMHKDFDRDFRGDTIHPSVLEILDQIGLAEPLHQMRHAKVSGPTLQFADGPFRPFNLARLKTRYPYILMVHQTRYDSSRQRRQISLLPIGDALTCND